VRLEPRSFGSRSAPRKTRITPGPAGRGRPPARPVPFARRVRRVAVPALFLGPVIVYALVFFAYPLIFGFAMSVEQFNFAALVSGSGPFVGLANYRAVLADPVTIAALRNTALFTVTSVVFQVVISLALAVLLNQKFFLGGVLRRLVLVPWLIPLVATGTIFAQLFGAQNSLINSALQHLGIIHSPIAWLIHYAPAMTALILVNIWAGLPFNTIVFYSGLQDLDPTLHEAAKVDGASAWQRFLHITLPLMRPVIAIVAMIGIIATVKVFDLVIVITGGGPNNATQLLSTWAYTQAFTNFDFGRGAAVGNILLVLSIIVAVFYVKTLKREDA
jgi:multiple sugar transport system permease protein